MRAVREAKEVSDSMAAWAEASFNRREYNNWLTTTSTKSATTRSTKVRLESVILSSVQRACHCICGRSVL
jgi:hypothetical protein